MIIANIQRFCVHDGPGVRTTVFFKGCPLKCAWCHNPETQSPEKEEMYYKSKCIGCGQCAIECPTGARETVGREYTLNEIMGIIEKDRVFYGENGGVTLSGGEPFLQKEEVISLLKKCKEHNINTCVETCGYFDSDILLDTVSLTDLFLWDVKDTDSQRHKKYTGVSNEKIIKNLIKADSLGAKTQIRCILVNGVNTDEGHYAKIAELYQKLKHCQGVEFISYHPFGNSKYEALDRSFSGGDQWIPTKEQLSYAQEFLNKKG